ncbi:MAG: SDR family NAD(P)-dependent oxidoreductase [Rhodospirillaceae bacterium]
MKLLHLGGAFLMLLASTASAETVLIAGANSGIGLEFAKQYAARGAIVIATHRRTTTPETPANLQQSYPNTVTVERIDVRDLDMIQEVADKYHGTAIDNLISNAALNMAMITVARATAPDGIIVASLHPGGVKVGKLEEFDVSGFRSPSESVDGMVTVIDELTPEQSGVFLDWKGRLQSW